MALSIFDDRGTPPKNKDLEKSLGRSYRAWVDLTAWLEERFAPVTQTWQFTGADWGWSLKVQQKKRAILYLTPQSKSYLVGFALGEKAVKAAIKAGLPDETLEILKEAPRYAEGRGVRLQVKKKGQNAPVKTLAEAKMGT